MSRPQTDARLLSRANFPHIITERIRYRDMDMLGHLNNAVYSTLSETARALWLKTGSAPSLPDYLGFVVVRMLIDFRHEIGWPADVDVATGVVGVGTSSFRCAQSIFLGEVCAATLENVIVATDRRTRTSMALPVELRAWLNRMMLRQP